MFDRDMSIIFPYETWLFYDKHPEKRHVMNTISDWAVYSHGLRLNEVILDGGKPKYKRDRLFYLPKETDQMVEFLAAMSLAGYRVYAISKDTLSGIFFDRDETHQTDIDADFIQSLIDYAKRVEDNKFIDGGLD